MYNMCDLYARQALLLKVVGEVVAVVVIVRFNIYAALFSVAKSLKAKLIIIIKVYQN